jgi:hypothetical protein
METWFKMIEFASSYPIWARLLALGWPLVTVVTLFLVPRVSSLKERHHSRQGKYKDLPKNSELWVCYNGL